MAIVILKIKGHFLIENNFLQRSVLDMLQIKKKQHSFTSKHLEKLRPNEVFSNKIIPKSRNFRVLKIYHLSHDFSIKVNKIMR